MTRLILEECIYAGLIDGMFDFRAYRCLLPVLYKLDLGAQ